VTTTKDSAVPSFTVDVDLMNPGQFLACCGLLELASRINTETTGRFDGRQFHLSGVGAIVVEKYAFCCIKPFGDGPDQEEDEQESSDGDDAKEEKSPPMWIGNPFDFRLDWWTELAAVRAGFKMWGAGMTVAGFFDGTDSGKGESKKHNSGMREHLARALPATRALLTDTEAIDRPSPFMFDSRLSRNTTIDLGFGGGVTFAFSPAVELLAIVGLQRFRPKMEVRWDRNSYHIWREPLPVAIAAAVAAGLVRPLSAGRYEFAVKPRDAQGRYKAFGPSRLQPDTERTDR
jgi:CRISPR-associated protein Csb3